MSISKIPKYWKFVTAAIGMAATVYIALGVHNQLATIVVAAAGALGVLAVPNKSPAPAAPAAAAPAPTNVTVIPPKAAP